jgi:glucose/arabinose dehydrogenase
MALLLVYGLGLVTATYRLFPYEEIRYVKQAIKTKLSTAPDNTFQTTNQIMKTDKNIKVQFLIPKNIKQEKTLSLNHFHLNWSQIEVAGIKKLASFEISNGSVFYVNQKNPEILKRVGLSIKNVDLNGGIKSIFKLGGIELAYIAYENKGCYQAALFNLQTNRQALRLPCLPFTDLVDFNGIGGGGLSLSKGKYLLATGTPTTQSEKIRDLAQNQESPYGKVLQLELSSTNQVNYKIYSSGHRNPQGIDKLYGKILSVEHGPMGGDEINIIKEGKNYGWPEMSIGSHYALDEISKNPVINPNVISELPLFAFNPSIGISNLGNCPKSYRFYYEPLKCVAVSSMRGNSIFLLLTDPNLTKVLSIEQLDFETRIRKFNFIDDQLYAGTDHDGLIVGTLKTVEETPEKLH